MTTTSTASPSEIVSALEKEPIAFERLLTLAKSGGTGSELYRQFVSEFPEMEQYDARDFIGALVSKQHISVDILSGTVDLTNTGRKALGQYALIAVEDNIPQYLREANYDLEPLLDSAYNIFQSGSEITMVLCTQQASNRVGQIIFSKTGSKDIDGLVRFELDIPENSIINKHVRSNHQAYQIVDSYALMLTLAGFDVSLSIRDEVLDEDYDENYDEDDEPNFNYVHQISLYDPKRPPKEISVLTFTEALDKLGVKP